MKTKQASYSILSNYRWGIQQYNKFLGSRYHLTDLMCIFFGVLLPFVEMAFSQLCGGAAATGFKKSNRYHHSFHPFLCPVIEAGKYLLSMPEQLAAYELFYGAD